MEDKEKREEQEIKDRKDILGFDRAELTEWMRKSESENAGQERYAKKQYTMSKISAGACVCVLLIVIFCAAVLLPQVLHTLEQMNAVMTELETVSSDLAQADLSGMLEHVDSLAQTSEEGMAEALEKISALDIESLNEAIRDLQAVVEPMARLFGR